MKFVVITHVVHKKHHGKLYAYGPYVKEMNLWLKHIQEFILVAPVTHEEPSPIDLAYDKNPHILQVPSFSLINPLEILKTLGKLPFISLQILRGMSTADHIHLRLPGNMGLLGSIFQIFFPGKTKTIKYAGNWDPASPQPWSYKLQKSIVANSFLTRNAKVLVYGHWDNQSKNIVPFFTASYSEKEIHEIPDKKLIPPVKALFVGTLLPGKRSELAIQAVEILLRKGIDITLDIYGDGKIRKELESYVHHNRLNKNVFFHGKQPAEVVKKAYQKAHFLLFPSQSEGWPKVVAEAMLWKCLPITTSVSATPFMLNNNERGSLIEPSPEKIASEIQYYLSNPPVFQEKTRKAYQWSKTYTLERFEKEIKKFLNDE